MSLCHLLETRAAASPSRILSVLLASALLGGVCASRDLPAAEFPASVPQGSLVIGHVAPGSEVHYGERSLRVGADGSVTFGVDRDQRGAVKLELREPGQARRQIDIEVSSREWPVERVVGVPPKTVEPPPEIAARIRGEQARVAAARRRDDPREDFAEPFMWPVRGRISGRFGNRRVYAVNQHDVPEAPHSGMDIAVPKGTPVHAPVGGIVSFADPDLYLTGGTVLIDHGHGVSSNFLHLSRIDVKLGQRVERGQVIGAAGRTGRASGPHLHWGLNWFEVRLDPLLLPGIAD